jgi:hypothetical protein
MFTIGLHSNKVSFIGSFGGVGQVEVGARTEVRTGNSPAQLEGPALVRTGNSPAQLEGPALKSALGTRPHIRFESPALQVRTVGGARTEILRRPSKTSRGTTRVTHYVISRIIDQQELLRNP